MLTMWAVLFLSLFIIGSMRMVRADESTHYNKSFVSIEIENGETLTSIAEDYAISAAYYTDYIEEVKSINNLKDDTIHAGCYLMVPVYQPIMNE